MLGGVFAHLDADSSDYSGVVGARLGLHAEKHSKQHPVGLHPHEGFAKWTKIETWKIPLGLRFKYSIP
jgi:hypothetical protein